MKKGTELKHNWICDCPQMWLMAHDEWNCYWCKKQKPGTDGKGTYLRFTSSEEFVDIVCSMYNDPYQDITSISRELEVSKDVVSRALKSRNITTIRNKIRNYIERQQINKLKCN